MLRNETIYALSTCYGKSAIAIIRITGIGSLKILKHFYIKKDIEHKKASIVKIYSSKNILIDECLILYFKRNNSYTGLDLIELHLHGSIAVINKVLYDLSLIKDFRMAKPGEFTRLSLENNKISSEKAEAIVELINAETHKEHEIASKIYNGELYKIQKKIKHDIIELLSDIEVSIDFPEGENKHLSINNKIKSIIDFMRNMILSFKEYSIIKNGINVTITGDVNSGKSTLINLLTKSDRSIVSNIPGTTRDIIHDKIEIIGENVVLHDTAGIRSSKEKIELMGINKSLKILKKTDIIIYVHDIVKNMNKSFFKTIKRINTKSPIILIGNKIDLTSKREKYLMLNIDKYNVQIKNILLISLNRKINYKKIKDVLEKIIKKYINKNREVNIITLRQKNILEKSIRYLNKARLIKESELKIEEIRNVINIIEELIGNIQHKDILNKIFSNFCIGK